MREEIIAEFSGCEPAVIGKKEVIERIFLQALEGYDVRNILATEFSPYGLTIVAVLGKSHAVLHTFPEEGRVSVDAYTCSGYNIIVERLAQLLHPKDISAIRIGRDRGLEVVSEDLFKVSFLPGLEVVYRPKKVLASIKSNHQKIDIIEHEKFGKMLFLDGAAQVAESDIEIYNDEMVRDLNIAGEKCTVLGGGDGFLARRLFNMGAGEVICVEIDKQVAELCREWFGVGNAVPAQWIYEDAFNVDESIFKDRHVFLDFTDIPLGHDTRTLFWKLLNRVSPCKSVTVYAGNILDSEIEKLICEELQKNSMDVKVWYRYIVSFMAVCRFIRGMRKN
ncbi:MAG: bifunctional adenosylmethionine decarboxylase/class I SAM-dependent methyltransferase [candidate division WOR-3 bacterium]|nr:bifunctional adenosylmethionine decarboxylase/class I SAM-dependent methyltransferase [candidate division WOR-3 bacterium]